jgi:hypothetical protein
VRPQKPPGRLLCHLWRNTPGHPSPVTVSPDFSPFSKRYEVANLTKKPPSNVVEYPDAHAAIDGLLDAWLPRLIESNEILTDALLRVRDLVAAEQVRAEVELALQRAARAKNGF